MIYVSTIVLLPNGTDTYFVISEFDCGRETTIRLLSKKLSLEDDLSVYYQIASKGRISSPVFFASGRVHDTYYDYEQLSYPSLHYRAVFSKEKTLVGITADECPYNLMIIHDLGRDVSWPRDRAERFAGKAGMLSYFDYCVGKGDILNYSIIQNVPFSPAPILEKAYLAMLKKENVSPTVSIGGNDGSSVYLLGFTGEVAEDTLMRVMGLSSNSLSIKTAWKSPERTEAELRKRINKEIVILGSDQERTIGGTKIVKGHAYALLDYDAVTQKFLIANPHNDSSYTGGARFDLSAAQIINLFDIVTYTGGNK